MLSYKCSPGTNINDQFKDKMNINHFKALQGFSLKCSALAVKQYLFYS